MSDSTVQQIQRLRLCFLVLFLFAAFVRLVGIDWDQGHFFHPDERRIAFAVEELSFRPLQLNPHFFAYGSFPLYVTRVVSSLLSLIHAPWGNYNSIIWTGRIISGVLGTLTVVLLVLLGTRLHSRRVGLLAGFLLATCVLHIQNSHYMTTDIFLTFLVLLALYFLIGVVRRGWARDYTYAGIVIGLAVATKFSALPLLVPLVVAGLVRRDHDRYWLPMLGYLLLAMLVGGLAFVAGQPYALLDFAAYSHDIEEQSRMVRNAGLLPYTNQYIGTLKYRYDITQLVLWGMAPPLGLAAVWATARRAIGTLRDRRAEDVVLLSWVLPFFLMTGWFEVKFIRYLLPIYPIMILWASAWLWRHARGVWFQRAAFWTVVVGSFLAALAFVSIYTRDHTVVTASEWVYQYLPKDSVILTQHWDEGFPMPLPGYSPSRFKVIDLPYYEPDSHAKIKAISQHLTTANYIAFQTKRLYGSLTRAPHKYPLNNNFFYLLFGGDLGYTLIYDHTSRPGLFGIEFLDELADESFTVYDHPKVLIFENTGKLSAVEIADKVMHGLPSRKLTRTDLLLAEVDRPKGFETGQRSPLRSSWLALICFAIFIEVLGLSAHAILSRWVPVVGCYALAKVMGVLVFAYIPWILTSFGLTDFTRGTLSASALLLLLTGLAARRSPVPTRRGEWWSTEFLFWSVFLFFLTVRAFNPEVFWGEKAMDFAFLNTLTRAINLPPPEPWFAGSMLHYSYFGHYLIAALGKACHIHPSLTFNLGIALIGGLTAVAAFAAGCAISNRWQVGILAAVFSTMIGNLSGIREFWHRRLITFDYFWATSRVIKDTINEYPFWSFLFADLHAHVLVMPFSLTFVALGLWWVRRPDAPIAIRSFPLFVMLGLTLGAITVTNTWSTFIYIPLLTALLSCVYLVHVPLRTTRVVVALSLLSLHVALFAVEHQYPRLFEQFLIFLGDSGATTYTGLKLVLASLIVLILLPRPVLTAISVIGLAYALYAPYWWHWRAPAPNWELEGDAFAHLVDFTNIFGVFLFVCISFLFMLWRRQILTPTCERLGWLRVLAMWVVGLSVAVSLAVSEPAVNHFLNPTGVASVRTALFMLAILGLYLALQRPITPLQRFSAFLMSFGFFVTAGTDVIRIWDRMNTVFKFYVEAWLLFSVAAAAVTAELWRSLFQSRLMRRTWQIGLVALIGGSVFTAGTGLIGVIEARRVPTPRPTLDGIAYLALRHPHEAAAFEWLNREIAGIPVVAEAYGPSYQEFARVSSNTGLPTVLGWDYHVYQRAQLWTDINRRKGDLKELYTSDNKNMVSGILERYHVSLVYVGKLERRVYAGGNLERFIQWTDLFTPIYQNIGVAVFAVNGQFTGAIPITNIEKVPQMQEKVGDVMWQAPERQLWQPRGVGVDSEGKVYVADFGNARIQKFNARFEYVTSWGKKGDLPGQFNQPGDVFIDVNDTVYVADTWNHRVQVFNNEGEYLREWTHDFYGPRGITVSADGKVYLTDTGNHRVLRFDQQGEEELSWGSWGSKPGQFKEPVGITTDTEGRVYVCDNDNARVQIFDRDGKFLNAFHVEGWESKVFSEPHIIVLSEGTIWVTVPLIQEVRAYDWTGNMLHQILGRESLNRSFQRPMGITFLPASNELVVTDLENRLVHIPLPGGVP